MSKPFVPIMKRLRKELIQYSITTDIVAIAASGSCYLKFRDTRLGKIRISNHDERSSYGYKWQLRSDLKKPEIRTDKGHKQFFYPTDMLEEFVTHVVNYRKVIERNYKGPKHFYIIDEYETYKAYKNEFMND